jgi:hypothetical protein
MSGGDFWSIAYLYLLLVKELCHIIYGVADQNRGGIGTTAGIFQHNSRLSDLTGIDFSFTSGCITTSK